MDMLFRACDVVPSPLLFTLFTVTVSPVHPASLVPEEAPRSDSAVRVPALIMLPDAFARVTLREAAHLTPVHTPCAGLGDVDRAPIRGA